MPLPVGIFLTKLLYEICAKKLGNKRKNTDINYYVYSNFDSLIEMYNNHKNELSAVITDTLITHRFLWTRCKKDDLPISSFIVGTENVYRTLLVEGMIKRQANLEKTGLDFIDPSLNLKEALLNQNTEINTKNIRENIWNWSEENIDEIENYIPEIYEERYDLGNLEFVITRNERVLEFAQTKNITAFFVCPTITEMDCAFDEIINEINTLRHNKNLPAVITFDLGTSCSYDEAERKETEFKRAVFDFENKAQVNLSLRSSRPLLEIYTDALTIKLITCDFNGCWLSGTLKSMLNFKVKIGYGIGENILQARMNSSEALAACCAYESIRLINKDRNEYNLSPCAENSCVSINLQEKKLAEQISSKCGLSSEIIAKFIICIRYLGRNEVSSYDLINMSGISLRCANKYLSKLEQAGVAYVCGQKSPIGKGRPTKIYRIDIL